MHSCIYTGKVRHRRFSPSRHQFVYRIYLLLLDLDEIKTVFKNRWLWSSEKFNFACFKSEDHLRTVETATDNAGGTGLANKLRSYLRDRGFESNGPIRLLTQLRYLGFVMNPVSFFYCYREDGYTLECIVAQVNNTPWGEEHLYLIDNRIPRGKLIAVNGLSKQFHVSPFMPLEMHYDMQFTAPANKLAVRMTNYHAEDKMLDVVMTLEKKEITTVNLMSVLASYPLISWKVFSAIYWQALRLYLKKIPFYPHPGRHAKISVKETSL